MPTFGSLFSGIGGLDLGLERAGWTCRWQVEIDPFCQRVLAKHWPDVPRYGDITTLTGAELEQKVDLIAGGFPCQPVSEAGQRRGPDDARWLWPDFARIVGRLRPRFVLVENVPGLRDRGMGEVLGELARLGFDAEWDSLPAAAVGARHLRERVFIFAAARTMVNAELLDARHVACPEEVRGWTSVSRVRLGLSRGAWAVEPDVGRVAYGVPARVDRLRGLGNAVVPQVAEWIGRRLLMAMDGRA